MDKIDWAPYAEAARKDLPLSEELLEQYLAAVRPYLEAKPLPLTVEKNPDAVESLADCSALEGTPWRTYACF